MMPSRDVKKISMPHDHPDAKRERDLVIREAHAVLDQAVAFAVTAIDAEGDVTRVIVGNGVSAAQMMTLMMTVAEDAEATGMEYALEFANSILQSLPPEEDQ
jgi:hypothetical protein